MDICVVTLDDVVARFLILELSEAGFLAVQKKEPSVDAKLNIIDLDAYSGEIPEKSIGFSYSDTGVRQVQDFLPRPVSSSALLALVREKFTFEKEEKINVITVEKDSRMAKTEIGAVRLSEKELALLLLLLDAEILPRERAAEVFPEGESNVVDVYMHYLRKKLKTVCPYDVIKSKRSEGYSLIYPIEII